MRSGPKCVCCGKSRKMFPKIRKDASYCSSECQEEHTKKPVIEVL